jgi:hypothetical protein
MLWADEAGNGRRPIVAIEDHLYHTGELLEAFAAQAPARLGDLTVGAIDRSGPDTASTIAHWRRRYPAVRIVTLDDLPSRDLPSFARAVAALVRPGGVVLQDVQLSTLPFVPADRWWETIYIAATVRGLFAERPPSVRFCSNKRGYDATFGKELLEAGFDPRDVMDKSTLADIVVPAVLKMAAAAFPGVLRSMEGGTTRAISVGEPDRDEVARQIDLVFWNMGDKPWLGGCRVASPVALRAGSAEAATWSALIEDRLAGGSGLSVVSVGERLSEPGAERAEITNLAARHAHTLRNRLRDADTIVTANHAYQIATGVSVAIVA